MAKRNVIQAPKRVKVKEKVPIRSQKVSQADFLRLLIAQTAKCQNLSDGRPDHGSVAQLKRLKDELAALIGAKK